MIIGEEIVKMYGKRIGKAQEANSPEAGERLAGVALLKGGNQIDLKSEVMHLHLSNLTISQ